MAAVLLVPEQGTDVGKLIPVELVMVYEDDGMVGIQTDTGNTGKGKTIEQAVQNLKDTASGEIFLDTAEYLLVTEEAVSRVEETADYLKPSVRVCKADTGIDPAAAAEYLAQHHPYLTLKVAERNEIKEKLQQIDGTIILS